MSEHACPAPAVRCRPHVVIVLCDDLGYGDVDALVRAADHRRPHGRAVPTPNLDALAADGAVLTGMYCPAPVCAPSRASLLTGTTQGNCRLRDNGFDEELEDVPTLASVPGAAGYRTLAVGKWGLQGVPVEGSEPGPRTWPGYPTRRGFDEFFGYVRHADGHEHYPKEGLHRGPKQVWHDDREVSADLDGCYTTDLFTAFTKQWIVEQTARDPDQPFLVYLALDTPHAVQELPTGPFPEGAGLTGGLRWTGRAGAMINTAGGVPDSWTHPDHDGSSSGAAPWPEVYQRYATAVRRIDDCVGDLRALLEDLGIADDTFFVFTSDNGPSIESYLAEPLRADFLGSYGPFDGIKRDCWEGGLRVGALVGWPAAIPGGSAHDEPVQFQDLLPTVADLAGLRPPARSDGVSLVPLLTGVGERAASTVYVEYAEGGETPDYADFDASRRGRRRGQMQMLRIGDHVGVRYDVHSGEEPFEVYDVVHDPGERHDIAAARPDLERLLAVEARRRRAVHPGVPRPYDRQPVPALGSDEAVVELALRSWEPVTPWLPLPDPSPRSPSAGLEATAVDGRVVSRTDGYVEVARAGCYRFDVGDGEAVLRVHDVVVVDGRSDAVRPGCLAMEAGRHPFRLVVDGEAAARPTLRPCTVHDLRGPTSPARG